MTIEEAKIQVAKNHGQSSFESAMYWASIHPTDYTINQIINEAMELYAQSKLQNISIR